MNLDRFWTELGQLFDKISRDGGVRAVVLASAFPKVFTAGLDCTSVFPHISLPHPHSHILTSFYHSQCNSNRRRHPLLLPLFPNRPSTQSPTTTGAHPQIPILHLLHRAVPAARHPRRTRRRLRARRRHRLCLRRSLRLRRLGGGGNVLHQRSRRRARS